MSKYSMIIKRTLNSVFETTTFRTNKLTLIILLIVLISCDTSKKEFKMATGAEGGTYLGVGSQIANLFMNDSYQIKPYYGNTFNGINNAIGVLNNEFDFCLAQNDVDIDLDKFLSLYKDTIKTKEELRIVMPIYPEILFIICKKDIHANNLTELLKGRKIGVGPFNSDNAEFCFKVFNKFGIDTSSIKIVYSETKDNAISDSIDVSCNLAGFNNRRIANMINELNGKIFSLDNYELMNKGSSVDGFCLNYKRAKPIIIPRNVYGNEPSQPVLTIAIDCVLLTKKSIDKDIIYDISKTIYENRPILSKSNPLLGTINEQFDLSSFSYPLHDGARMYLERNKPTFVEENVDLIGLLITIVAMLFGGISGFFKIMKHNKKDRIDKYYNWILKEDLKISISVDVDQLIEIENKITKIRNLAFKRLIKEELVADESFNIFNNLVVNTIEKIERRKQNIINLNKNN